ncbi:MAG: SMP-30/gluconolactonase/LRE family protein [Candidatus Eremiobacteraeota bacterium]|nr:SMP-30/gluconolactonase/LRE family protein [Candidatus Eremiobacteraeota bacterium]
MPACAAGPYVPLRSTEAAIARSRPASGFVYVAGGIGVSSYATSTGKPEYMIRTRAKALALDAAGDLAAAGIGSINVYAPKSSSLLRTIPAPYTGTCHSLAFDASGDLYAAYEADWYSSAQFGGKVMVFGPGATTPARTILSGVDHPNALALDASENLYVSNPSANAVTVYPAGTTSPSRTITAGILHPDAIAFDAAGNLYVANQGLWDGTAFTSSSIAVYAPGGSTPIRILTSEISAPSAMALDDKGNVYVANDPPFVSAKGWIAEYRAGSASVLRTIRAGIDKPSAIALDSSGNLYVANRHALGTGSLTVYSPASSQPARTITTLVFEPIAISVGGP